MRRTVVLVSATALVIAGALVAPPAVTAAEATASVQSVTVDPGPFTVDGFTGQAQSTITAVVDEPSFTIGTVGAVECTYVGVKAVLERTSGGPRAVVAVDLPRVSGSGSVGRYSAPWRIASTRTGTWTLTRLAWCAGMAETSVDPRVTPGVTRTITVVGTNAPTASYELVPATVPYVEENLPLAVPFVGRQLARFTYRTSTGAPIVGATVLWGTEYSCTDPMPPTPGGARWGELTLRTDAHGQVAALLHYDFNPGQTCVSLLGPPAVAGDLGTRALIRQDWPYPRHLYKWVSATPLARTVRVNRTVTVTGSAYPGRGTVWLQRVVGRTWRTVATARIRTSGRYTVSALATTVGTGYYRVVALRGDATLVPTASRALRVTVTR